MATVLQQMTLYLYDMRKRLEMLEWERSQLAQQIQTRKSLGELQSFQFEISDLEEQIRDQYTWIVANRDNPLVNKVKHCGAIDIEFLDQRIREFKEGDRLCEDR